MREIKFRIWTSSNDANINGKMYYPGDMVEAQVGNHRDGSSGAFIINQSGVILMCRADMMRKENGLCKASISNNGLSLMQFTGLKDKNGKDIYEDDIVLWGFKGEETAQIRWSVTHFEWEIYVLPPRSPHSPDGMKDFWSDRIEVIGNIHENPELLK